MTTERLKYLYDQYQSGSLSLEEQQQWSELLSDPNLQAELEQVIPWFDFPGEELTGLSQSRSTSMISEIVQVPQERAVKKDYRLWPRIAVAAAVATLMVSMAIWFYKGNQQGADGQAIAYQNDVAPGKQGATLTLAGGKQIRLGDAKSGLLASQSGVTISKTASGQLVYEIKDSGGESNEVNTLSTGKGETYQVRLPDGSSVWLNAASSLRYPASFARLKNRSVALSGEGYFEIAKDKAHPFIVKTGSQQVEVLGTHFNVNDYRDGAGTATTLLEGSVKLSAAGAGAVLVPGEVAVLSKGSFAVSQADLEESVAWKNGDIIFNREKIGVIMNELSRWYDIEVSFEGEPTAELFYTKISRNKNISEVLKSLEQTRAVHFRIEGRRVFVSR